MSKSRKYPFTAYALTPAMLVKKVTITEKSWRDGHHYSDLGKSYPDRDLHRTQVEAIAAGRADLDCQRARLAKLQANIDKRAANLDKADAKL